jgi:phosphoribosylanthranilate isomerase
MNRRGGDVMDGHIKIKVCGMRDPDNIADVAQLHPDFMGFIFYRPSPRYVGDHFRVPQSVSPHTRRVGVFVNELTAVIAQKAKEHGLDFVQLHGNETAEECLELKNLGIGVIKVFSVGDESYSRIPPCRRLLSLRHKRKILWR